ncbi:hypothetical protein CPLU01_13619 [Colletotrichum plurivorum]|uniref:Uncharacterized protein n=1 Tax=Colletotrichum plurivorum TaxID=2175906 RepID=A0A8H6N2P0_9PEZI|nr:hypothetical protein CPLU01_13619 [Colletotrichum plurivorum]
MKVPPVSFIFFFAAQALAACGPKQVELWDLQVIGGTAQCANFGCYSACPGQGSVGSCNGCTFNSGPSVRPLGGSYCCDSPIRVANNRCITRCPSKFHHFL